MHDFYTPRTDLALEAREMLTRRTREDIPGVRVETIDDDEIVVTRVHIATTEAAEVMGKKQGRYVTIEAGGLRYKNTPLQEDVMQWCAKELVALTELKSDAVVLIVGLGNWNVTPDALGPRVVDKIVVTRHLQSLLSPELKDGVRSVCAIAPGVLGITGMETSDIIAGIVQKIKPDLVVAIDALAAAASQRVVTTVQLTDTGINPGSGVGNKRFGLNSETLGVPVVAIGVPTVVHAATIAVDTIECLQQHPEFKRCFDKLEAQTDMAYQTLLQQILPESLGELMVTPKEVDRLIDDMAVVVAGSINQALHPNIDYENIHMYLHY